MMATFETSDGIRIHYEVEGPQNAPPLVFSNSLGTNLALWDGQAAEAARRFRVIRYDQRGHGTSDAPRESYTLERLGRDVVEMLDAIGVPRTDFCGIALGGMTGMWLGINAPERINRLVLANTSPNVPPATVWDERIRIVEAEGMKGLADRVLERWFSAGFQKSEPTVMARMRAMLLATNPAGYAGCCAAIRDMDLRVSIATISLPALVIVGEHDPTTPPGHGALIAESIHGSELIEVPGVAHLSCVEAPHAFNPALLGFLK